MNDLRTYTVLLMALICSTQAFGQERYSELENNEPDSSYSGKDPFGDVNPDETEEQKRERVLESYRSTIEKQSASIRTLQRDLARAVTTERFLMDFSLSTIQTMLRNPDTHIQLDGLQLLKSVMGRAEQEGALSRYESRLFRFCTKNLGDLIGSEANEVRGLAIQILEDYPDAGGIHLGFQPASGYWHPINDSIGVAAKTRKALLSELDVPRFFYTNLSEFFMQLKDYRNIEFDHDHEVDLESTEIEIEAKFESVFDVLDTVLRDYDLGYSVVGRKILIRPIGNDELNVTHVFNVRGLLSVEADISSIIEFLEKGLGDFKLQQIENVDKNRLMAVGTEQQLRKVAKLLGLLAAPASSHETPARNSTKEKGKGANSIGESAPKKQAEPALLACNRILSAIRKTDAPTLEAMCRPKDKPATEQERKEFELAVTEMKESITFTSQKTIMELRVGRSSDEMVGLIGVWKGEAFVIVISKKTNVPEEYFFRGLKSPDIEDFQTLTLLSESSNMEQRKEKE